MARQSAAAKAKAAVAADSGEQMCPEHFPLGWELVPEGFAGVACEHGSWTRTEPATPSKQQTPPAEDDGDGESPEDEPEA